MSDFVAGFEKMQQLQRVYTQLHTNLSTKGMTTSLGLVAELRDMVEELIKAQYGNHPEPAVAPGVIYTVKNPPPGYIIIDQFELEKALDAPAFDQHAKGVISVRIRELFKSK